MRRMLVPLVGFLLATAMLSGCSNSKGESISPGVGHHVQLCNDGRGLHFSPSTGVSGSGTTIGLSLEPGSVVEVDDHLTLVSFNTINAQFSPGPMQIFAVNPECRIDSSFGYHGVLVPSIPGVASNSPFSIWRGLNGRFFVASSRGEGWVIGEYTSTGTIDASFGDQGWVFVVPPGGMAGFLAEVTSLLVSPDGVIYVYGDNAQSHASVQPYLISLDANGFVNATYGNDGHVALFSQFTYAGSAILQPDGNIVVTGQLGGAGCYNLNLEWVSSTGEIQYTSDEAFKAAKSVSATSHRFWGAIFPDEAGGVGVVGQSGSCSNSATPMTSDIQEFNAHGGPVRSFGSDGIVKIATPGIQDFDYSDVVLSNHHLVVESYANESSAVVNYRDFQTNGSPVRQFGSDGLIRLEDPLLLTTFVAPSNLAALSSGDFAVLFPVQNGLTFEEYFG